MKSGNVAWPNARNAGFRRRCVIVVSRTKIEPSAYARSSCTCSEGRAVKLNCDTFGGHVVFTKNNTYVPTVFSCRFLRRFIGPCANTHNRPRTTPSTRSWSIYRFPAPHSQSILGCVCDCCCVTIAMPKISFRSNGQSIWNDRFSKRSKLLNSAKNVVAIRFCVKNHPIFSECRWSIKNIIREREKIIYLA